MAQVAHTIKNLPAMQETRVHSLGWKVPLEKGMAIHFSILAWRIPWTEEPGGRQSMRSQRVRHNRETNTHTACWLNWTATAHIYQRLENQPQPLRTIVKCQPPDEKEVELSMHFFFPVLQKRWVIPPFPLGKTWGVRWCSVGVSSQRSIK